ncbi:efflux RND transporter periplasmic adaptor subunit [Vibrio sp. ZSDE26]|uniref:Efflux RND transporter periplasmic adaptor subunit n=1 Tax=Vibrio amylolyticus TaxID=2847292 RepID=A0A9X1XHX1_9VIBR|nr:efflux RND transporter periplasmic adaptor subunit [Vibrio amylolyticus]MCK6262143.1 efflux RND transporter periplasmic adaptor subunit [Vibrio amylolyticus]
MNFALIARRAAPLIILGVFFIASQILIASKEEPEQIAIEPTELRIEVLDAAPKEMTFHIDSYGFVEPKYQSKVVSEISGRIVTLSPDLLVGGLVKKGQILANIDPSDYEADLEQAKASLAQAKASLEEELARAEVAKRDWAHVGEGEAPKLGLRVPQVKREQANVKFAQAAVKRAIRNVQRTVIRAPFDGLVSERHASLGEYLTVGAPIADIYDTQQAEVSLPITNSDLAYLPINDDVSLTATLQVRYAGQEFNYPATIKRSERVIDRNSRMFNLIAEIDDPYCLEQGRCIQPSLKFGSYVTAKVVANTVEDVVSLPRNLVRNGKAYVVNDELKLEQRNVNIIRQDEAFAYIQSSFVEGEQISVTPINQYSEEQIVTIIGVKENGAQEQQND